MQRPAVSDLVAAIFIGVIGVAVWWMAGSFPSLEGGHPGPGLFPRVIAAGLILSGIGLLFSSPDKTSEAASGSSWKRVTRAAGALFVVALFPFAPPIVGIAGLCLVTALLLGTRLHVAIGLTVAVGGLLYGLFALVLGVAL